MPGVVTTVLDARPDLARGEVMQPPRPLLGGENQAGQVSEVEGGVIVEMDPVVGRFDLPIFGKLVMRPSPPCQKRRRPLTRVISKRDA